MSLPLILAIAVGLGMDAFAVSVAGGVSVEGSKPRYAFRAAVCFGLFQFFMPIAGWLGGSQFAGLVGDFDHWIAFGLLAFVGGKMIFESGRIERRQPADLTQGHTLLVLSVATSIDALSAGLSFAVLGVSIWLPSVAAGVATFAMSLLGFRFGARLGRAFGSKVEALGGALLIAIGLRILLCDVLG